MVEKLVELSDQEVLIDFTLNRKCHANVRLKSLSGTTPIAFKVQTSSPHKFLLNPPTGLIPPSSFATFQIILKPQSQLPPSFPRSPSDRFLIKTAPLTQLITNSSHSINSFFTQLTTPTYDLKLKLAYVGVFLLRHAVSNGDLDVVKRIIKRQRSDIGLDDVESLIRIATESPNSEKMIELLRRAVSNNDARANFGNWIGELSSSKGDLLAAVRRGEIGNVQSLLMKNGTRINERDQYGLTTLHVAAIKGHKDVVSILIEFGIDIESKDKEGHTALHLAVEGGNIDTVEVLLSNGANVNAMSLRGSTPLYMARAMGYDDITTFLLDRGASCSSVPSSSSLA